MVMLLGAVEHSGEGNRIQRGGSTHIRPFACNAAVTSPPRAYFAGLDQLRLANSRNKPRRPAVRDCSPIVDNYPPVILQLWFKMEQASLEPNLGTVLMLLACLGSRSVIWAW